MYFKNPPKTHHSSKIVTNVEPLLKSFEDVGTSRIRILKLKSLNIEIDSLSPPWNQK